MNKNTKYKYCFVTTWTNLIFNLHLCSFKPQRRYCFSGQNSKFFPLEWNIILQLLKLPMKSCLFFRRQPTRFRILSYVKRMIHSQCILWQGLCTSFTNIFCRLVKRHFPGNTAFGTITYGTIHPTSNHTQKNLQPVLHKNRKTVGFFFFQFFYIFFFFCTSKTKTTNTELKLQEAVYFFYSFFLFSFILKD